MTDFNDLAKLSGPEAVLSCIAAASPVTMSEALVDHIGSTSTAAQVGKLKRYLKLVAVGIGEFLVHEFSPRSNLLSPWLPLQGLTMVYAYRGIGKTHFALAVAYAVASGGSFLGWKAPTPVGVLYIDGEMPGAVMQERLSAIVTSNDQEATAPFILLTPDLQPEGMPRIDTDEGQAAIESLLTDQIRLIVVDNISTLTGARENEADDWTPIQDWALKQRAKGRSVLFVHHSGKGGKQRGTSRREDVLDTVIALRRPVDYEPDQGAVFEVHFEKARGIHGEDVRSIEATLTTDDHGRMTWRTRTVENSTFDRVVALLNDGLNQNDIAAELGINKSNVSRHAKKAKKAGLIETKKRGGA
jgi:putative DNA primase/helicase